MRGGGRKREEGSRIMFTRTYSALDSQNPIRSSWFIIAVKYVTSSGTLDRTLH